MNGVVTEGWLEGAQVHESAAGVDRTTSQYQGTIRIAPEAAGEPDSTPAALLGPGSCHTRPVAKRLTFMSKGGSERETKHLPATESSHGRGG